MAKSKYKIPPFTSICDCDNLNRDHIINFDKVETIYITPEQFNDEDLDEADAKRKHPQIEFTLKPPTEESEFMKLLKHSPKELVTIDRHGNETYYSL